MVSEAAFVETIITHWGDSGPWLVYSDFLEEHGHTELAFAYRWCGTWKRLPMRRDIFPAGGRRVQAPFRWAWFPPNANRDNAGMVPESAKLPRAIYLPCFGYTPHRYYPSLEKSVAELADGLKNLIAALKV